MSARKKLLPVTEALAVKVVRDAYKRTGFTPLVSDWWQIRTEEEDGETEYQCACPAVTVASLAPKPRRADPDAVVNADAAWGGSAYDLLAPALRVDADELAAFVEGFDSGPDDLPPSITISCERAWKHGRKVRRALGDRVVGA